MFSPALTRGLTAVLLVSSSLSSVTQGACPLPTYLGSFQHNKVAFLNTIPNPTGGSDLYLTSFSGMPFSKGQVARVTNVQDAVSQRSISTVQSTVLDPNVKWPNGVSVVPEDVKIASTRGVMQVVGCGGFLVPTHGDGSCRVYDLDAEGALVQTLEIAKAGMGHFFHHAEFYDVDGDGWKDLVTAKAKKGLFGTGPGQLFWYKNPGHVTKKKARLWAEHLLVDGPDVSFELVDLNHDGVPEILSTQFFVKKLVLHYLDDGADFRNTSAWQARVLDDQVGELFNLTMVDLHGNGHESIVVTNHVTDAELAGVYAYDIPSDFKTGAFTRHMIVNDFPTLNSGPGQASPGGAVPVVTKYHPMMLAVSGDGNQKVGVYE